LNEGSIVKSGNIDEVISKYRSIVNKIEETNVEKEKPVGTFAHEGTGGLTIKSAVTFNESSELPKKIFTEKDKNIILHVEYVANKDIDDPVYEMTIYDGIGQRVFASNSIWAHNKTAAVMKKDQIKTEWTIPNVFASGVFTVSVSAGMSGGSVVLDRVENAGKFQVNKKDYKMKVIK
jgi:hypothetical protein